MNKTEPKRTNWHRVAHLGILVSKIAILLFLLSTAVYITWINTPLPYNLFFIGIEVSVFVISSFTLLRLGTFKPKKKYDPSHLKSENEQLSLLLIKITEDINRFEEGASYFFNGVRFYKYSTMILSGLSTILLGLSFKVIPFKYAEIYPEVAKNIAFVIGAIITIYTGLMTYWNIEKYWLQNKNVANKLRALRDEIENEDQALKFTSNSDEIQKKFEKYQLIKGEFYKYWEGALSGRNSQSNQ